MRAASTGLVVFILRLRQVTRSAIRRQTALANHGPAFPTRRHCRPGAPVRSYIIVCMNAQTLIAPTRRPRFRRASEPPPFRLTDDDVEIVRHLARHRFLRSMHIAALVGRSLDRANDRLLRLFHAAYIEPRAQLDFYPVGSASMVYALADRGARLLIERDGIAFTNVEWSRKNRKAGRRSAPPPAGRAGFASAPLGPRHCGRGDASARHLARTKGHSHATL